ncbi:MAG TPA: tetratricopeptide repeat protein [Treponemataceae bacterium]|nr:tetratricopeptide repeat protein [Treponemataceae bacterium]
MNKKATKDTASKVGSFIEKNRIIIITVFIVVLITLITIIIATSVSKSIRKSGLEKLDTLTVELAQAQKDQEIDAIIVQDILMRAKDLANSSHGTVAARAHMFAAEISFRDKNWECAKESWLQAAHATDAYTAPLCFYNAAICAEEMGDNESAIENYAAAISYESFALAPRAYFNMGRIHEQQGNYTNAIETYTRLVDAFASNDWANLAKSRIIALKVERKNAK